MEIITTANNLKLEHSNTVIVYEKQPVSLFINQNYTITFSFVDDGNDQNFTLNVVENGLNIVLRNFSNVLGTSTSQPIEFAAINGKSLYIAFCVQAIGDVKILQYNIYIKE